MKIKYVTATAPIPPQLDDKVNDLLTKGYSLYKAPYSAIIYGGAPENNETYFCQALFKVESDVTTQLKKKSKKIK